jgi:hypothetical protein
MRKLLFGLFGFAALGFGAIAAQPAEAQPYYPGYRHHYDAPVVDYARPAYRTVQYENRRPYREYRRPDREYRGPYREYRGGYRPPRPYGYYRPAYVAPRCVVRPQRVWTGYEWVRRPVRVCR